MSHKFFRAPVASYEAADAFVSPIVMTGGGFMFGPSNISTRPVIAGLVYWPLLYEPSSTGEAKMKQTFCCNYLLGEFAETPGYEPPEDIEEVTQQDYLDAKNTAFPPEDS
jgi:hypothetical protein